MRFMCRTQRSRRIVLSSDSEEVERTPARANVEVIELTDDSDSNSNAAVHGCSQTLQERIRDVLSSSTDDSEFHDALDESILVL